MLNVEGSDTWSQTFDLTDRNGDGLILVKPQLYLTGNMYRSFQSPAAGAPFSTTVYSAASIMYRFKNVTLTEYLIAQNGLKAVL